MYICKRKKPDLNENEFYDEEILEKYRYCLEYELYMLPGDKTYVKKIGVFISEIDIKTLAKDYKFKEKDYKSGEVLISYGKETYHLLKKVEYATNTAITFAEIPAKKFKEKYMFTTLEYFYLWKEEIVVDWDYLIKREKKADYFNLSDYITKTFGRLPRKYEFEKLNKEQLCKILNYQEQDKEIYEKLSFEEDSEYFYWH